MHMVRCALVSRFWIMMLLWTSHPRHSGMRCAFCT